MKMFEKNQNKKEKMRSKFLEQSSRSEIEKKTEFEKNLLTAYEQWSDESNEVLVEF